MLEFLALKVTSNIRELEGRIEPNRCACRCDKGPKLRSRQLKKFLQDLLRAHDRRITIDEIQRKVAEHYNLADGGYAFCAPCTQCGASTSGGDVFGENADCA